MELKGLQIQQEFFVFQLGRAGIFLGLEWLASLREVRVDFGQLKLTIGKGETELVLSSEPTISKFDSSLKKMMQELKQEELFSSPKRTATSPPL